MTDGTRAPGASRRRIAMERTYQAPIEDVWDLWTTKEGIESWWGPDGFRTTIHEMNVVVVLALERDQMPAVVEHGDRKRRQIALAAFLHCSINNNGSLCEREDGHNGSNLS